MVSNTTAFARCRFSLWSSPARKNCHLANLHKIWFRRNTTSTSDRNSCQHMILYNSLSHRHQPINATLAEDPSILQQKGFALYACGPTVYAPAHLGHARTYLYMDVLRRIIEHFDSRTGRPPPVFILNITDVDDKIIAAANASGDSPIALARRFEADFWTDWDMLNLKRPTFVTRVTEYVESHIIPYIQRILDSGCAYDLNNSGNIYFDVQAFDERMQPFTCYGKMAPPSATADFLEGLEDISKELDNQKKDPRDFALWKSRKDGETIFWSSPFGDGRPGWHIECSSMIQAVQEQLIDSHRIEAHAGGIDLKFPHHCNEIAQAEAFYDSELTKGEDLNNRTFREWIPHWIHTGHLKIEGLKMSKSLKNFITIQDMLLEGNDGTVLSSPADDFRFWCMSSSYRESATFSASKLNLARNVRFRIVQFLIEAELWLNRSRSFPDTTKRHNEAGIDLLKASHEVDMKCRTALRSDLDTHTFIQEITRLANLGRAYLQNDSCTVSEQPLFTALSTIRYHLSLTGFSDKTTRAGLATAGSSPISSTILGGEHALLNAIGQFRAAVRRTAVNGIRDSSNSKALHELLALCDEARDRIFPALGVELFDGRAVTETASSDADCGDNKSGWKYCIPRTGEIEESKTILQKPATPFPSTVPNVDYFRVGQYEGQYLEFDESGLPTVMSDGSLVSNRLRKKLQKKLEKRAKRMSEVCNVNLKKSMGECN